MDRVEQELLNAYVARQQLYQRWAYENALDPFGATTRRLERREERRRLERTIRELEALKRIRRASLSARIDAAGLTKRLQWLAGESDDD